MLGLLEFLAQGFVDIPWLIMAGVIEVLNGVFDVVALAGVAAMALLPSMPSIGSFNLEVLAEANWFYPFGAIASFMISALVMFGLWMAVRYILRVVRAA